MLGSRDAVEVSEMSMVSALEMFMKKVVNTNQKEDNCVRLTIIMKVGNRDGMQSKCMLEVCERLF